MTNFHTETLKTKSDFLNIESEYRTLFIDSDSNNVFLSPEWIFSWYRNYCTPLLEPLVITVRDKKGTLVGIWSFVKTYDRIIPGIKGNILKPMGFNRSEYCEPLFLNNDEQILFTMLDLLKNKSKSIDLIDIDRLPTWSTCAKPLISWLNKKPLRYILLPEEVAPFIKIKCDFDSYLLEQFSAKGRNNLRRLGKKLNKKGKALFLNVESRQEFDQALQQIEAIEDRSWKGKEQKGIFSSSDSKAFFQEILPIFFEKGWIYCSILIFDKIPIAYEIGFHFKNRSSLFNSSYLPEYSTHSPGAALRFEIIKRSFAQNDTHFDFMRGAANFKFQWTSQASRNHTIKIFGNTLLGQFSYLISSLCKPFRRRVRHALPKTISSTKMAKNIHIDSLE